MDFRKLKLELYNKCTEYLNERISIAQKAMRDAQESANEETKSSAGDKYETGRAMAQIERDKNAAQLSESLKLKAVLDNINPEKEIDTIGPGALISTKSGCFFLAISIGKISLQNTDCYIVSPASPIGKILLAGKKGASFNFNGKELTIEHIS